MSGVPGSGKSSIAKELASQLKAIVLDHDVTKSAILESGVSESKAGAASYEVIKALSKRLLGQGESVIVDSPCLYEELLAHGIHAAAEYNARYRYVECNFSDLEELDRRLRSRSSMPSQIQHLGQKFAHAGAPPRVARDLIIEWSGKVQRPDWNAIVLDTSREMAECVADALAFIRSNGEANKMTPNNPMQ